jgi:hypothetical protein
MRSLILIPIGVVALAGALFFLRNHIPYKSEAFEGDFGSGQFRNTATKNLSPYALFGDSSFVLMTETERTGRYVLSIPAKRENSPFGKIEIQLNTGEVTVLGKDGRVKEHFFMNTTSIAKFLAPDPHAENYTGWTPYNFVANNPLLIIDPDGRDWVITHDKEKNHYTFAFRGKVLNETGSEIKDLDAIAAELFDGLAEVYTGDGKANGEDVSWSFDRENSYIEVATSEDDLAGHDHAIRIVKHGTEVGGREIGGGRAQFGSQAIYLNEKVLENRKVADYKTSGFSSISLAARGLSNNGKLVAKYIFAHEAGHTAYLPHLSMPETKVGSDYISQDYFDTYKTGSNWTEGRNIMSNYQKSLYHIAPILTPKQVQVMNKRFVGGMLNNGKQNYDVNDGFVPKY